MRRLHPSGLLLVAVAAVAAFQVAYVVAGIEPSPAAALLSPFALALAFIAWVEADARRRHRVPCHEFGFLVAVFFPASLLWYTLWSRGWRGVLTLAALVGLMLLPSLAAIVAWLLRYGLA